MGVSGMVFRRARSRLNRSQVLLVKLLVGKLSPRSTQCTPFAPLLESIIESWGKKRTWQKTTPFSNLNFFVQNLPTFFADFFLRTFVF